MRFLIFAHQPRIEEGAFISVFEPEISKAYYSKLSGTSHIYEIVSEKAFDLYVNLLVPDIAFQKRDVSAIVIKSGDIYNNPLAVLDGSNFQWERFFEPFGHDTYWKGPEFKTQVPAGKYQIIVTSSQNDSKYSLAIGEIEAFDLKEGLNAVRLIPKIKNTFFDKLPIDFILSPFGWGLILAMFLLAVVFVLILKLIIKKAFRKGIGEKHNVGKKDRIIRAIVGLVILIFAIFTSWHPLLFFLSGILFFTAISPWCGLYTIFGKNTC
jgi:hypothetical protein